MSIVHFNPNARFTLTDLRNLVLAAKVSGFMIGGIVVGGIAAVVLESVPHYIESKGTTNRHFFAANCIRLGVVVGGSILTKVIIAAGVAGTLGVLMAIFLGFSVGVPVLLLGVS